MARTGSGVLLSRRNIKLDSFLKRNTERMVYERIRAYEPCVVKSATINKVYMHVVLSDERVYLTEYPPRTLTEAFCFRDVQDIELVNDLPDFLRGKDRELCQHIRITYITDKPAARGCDWLRRDRRVGLPPRRPSLYPTITHTEGHPVHSSPSEMGTEEVHMLPPTRSASCPNPETLGLLRVPHPPTQSVSTAPSLYSPNGSPASPPSHSNHRLNIPDTGQLQRRIGSVLSRLLRRDCANSEEEREAELHLYAISHTSRLYLHIQSSWTSFIIRSTLLLDTLYRGRCSASSDSSSRKQLPAISCERTAHLFGQLSSELLQEGIRVESLYLLLQELRTAARHNVALRRLFWKSSEVCVFLVQTLEESLHSCQSLSGVHTEDQLLLSTLVVQTLAAMFRETDVEPARLNLLSAKKGALASRMLLALICDAALQTQVDCELQALLTEYLDAACSLLFELLLLGHEASRCSSADTFLSVGWILRVLQPHPHLLSFISYQAQQVVLVLSDGQESFLSPFQSVLLFQRCRLLLACLQYNSQLAQHLRSHFREEFRYSVKLSCAQEKLPPHYPISRPTLRLVQQILTLILHR
ncbi:hypothetical protein EPR50_G00229870 [Perca flavescens]|uniref:Uncharacterized protein n=1 Tax=Perca flavescens TaxID=8167 RepID=A0A484BZ25_PERFV|nr:uncharacterized protein C12orf56 homolog isoform X1 [Perca flavescens]TDG96560.1 hypothetical protein EPR50_G00229870 [Perca flavescens]